MRQPASGLGNDLIQKRLQLIYPEKHTLEVNKTNELRLACAYGIIPEEAEMRYYWNNNGQVEEYASNPEYFMTKNIFTGPHGLTKLKDVNCNFHQLTEDEFCEFAGIEKPSAVEVESDSYRMKNEDPGLWKKIKSFWS